MCFTVADLLDAAVSILSACPDGLSHLHERSACWHLKTATEQLPDFAHGE
jgi:hypothetical protein